MDTVQDLEFHDDSGAALEKAKESILLIKKKMFRSHDLILQYNNKLKECERLKGDLCTVQEEAIKLKRDNSTNLSKVVKLEMQSSDFKKCRQELEQKIMEKEIQIASDKSHLQQLQCKLEAMEEKHGEKLLEAELNKSSMEEKVKVLEKELKALKKSHLSEINKLGRRVFKSPKKKEKDIETREIGVNTVKEIKQSEPVKRDTMDKSVLTNDFYHIKDDPYPIFCDRCETLMEPKIEKICKIMSHPPLVGNMLSPIRHRVPERQPPNLNDPNNLALNRHNAINNVLHRDEPMCTGTNLSDTNRVESNPNEPNRLNTAPRNFVSPLPLQSAASSAAQEIQATAIDATAPELENLRRKVATLERKIKKQKTQKSSDSHPPTANCCSHPHPVNFCGHSSTHVNPVSNVFPNTQAELMTEFFNRMMNLANEREVQKNTKANSSRKEPTLRDKRVKHKLRKLKRVKSLKAKKSGNWNVESDDCNAERVFDKRFDPSDPTKPHLLRIKPSVVRSPVASFSDAESEKSSPAKDSWEACFAENSESTTKVPDKSQPSKRGRKRGRASLFGDDSESETEVKLAKNGVEEGKLRKNATRRARTRSKSLREDEDERKGLPVKKSNLGQENAANSSRQSAINEPSLISSDNDVRDRETCIFAKNSAIDDSVSDTKAADDSAQTISGSMVSDADRPDISGSEASESTDLRERQRKLRTRRSSSPKVTKRTGRTNLLGKLRALKKNSVGTVAKTSNASTIHATRSLSRRKLTEPSEGEDFEGATKESAASASGDEPSLCVPVKKQRVAHAPKRASSIEPIEQELATVSKTSKLEEFSHQVRPDANETSKNDSAAAKIKRPLTRRSAVEKSAEIKAKDDRKSSKIIVIDQAALPGGVPGVRRRGRPPKRKVVAIEPPLDLEAKASLDSRDKSPEKQSDLKKIAAASVSPKSRNTDSSQVAKDAGRSLEDIGVEDSAQREEILRPVPAELVQAAEVSIGQSDGSLTPRIFTEEAPAEKTEVDAEKPTLLDASSESPAASLDEVSTKTSQFSISPNRSAVSTSAVTTIEENGGKKDSPECTSAETRDVDNQNTDTLVESKVSLNSELANETIPDESPASPDATPSSPVKKTRVSSPSMRPEERLSIYDSVALSIPLKKDANSSSFEYYVAPAENATVLNPFSIDDGASDAPIEKPIGRKLVVYDTNLHGSLDAEDEESESRNIANPQFFVEASAVAKERASGGAVETLNVVKELRSRQVLYSPSSSANHQNLQKTQSPSNEEIRVTVSSDTRLSQPDCYSKVRSLGTLLNRHLGEQKRKPLVKNSSLRKDAAIKLQETAEKNVKAELGKLIESEEWTSELHQSVMAKILGFRSERTVAKSIVDFLVERASLNEPLDRTYTPPAPVMTRSQQRIVTLVNCLEQEDTMPRIFNLVQAGIEYTVFRLGGVYHSMEVVEYLVRILTVFSRIRKDRERVRMMCCDAFYCLGRRALPVLHAILTVWPEVLPKHGTSESELPNCLAHLIKLEIPGNSPFPKVLALKTMIRNYYEYPENQAQSTIVMKVLMKAFHEKYSSDLEAAILLISKREGTKWAHDNVIEQGLMNIIRDDNYQWQYEAMSLLGFIVRTFPMMDTDKSVQKYVDLLCQMLDSVKGSHDKQEGVVSALLSLSRHKPQFVRISDSLLKWQPSRELRASTLERLDLFFKSHTPCWWNMRLQYKIKKSEEASGKSNLQI